jgi:hypothetical protein
MEALVLVEKTAELKRILKRFYGALGLPFRPSSIGDLPKVDVPQAIEALADVVRERYGTMETKLGEATLLRARALRKSWRATPGPSGWVSSNL